MDTRENRDPAPAEKLKQAFQFIEAERQRQPERELGPLIEQACARHGLTAAQGSWLRWTLDPGAVAIQPKEPNPTKH